MNADASAWLTMAAALWAVFATLALLWRNPLPFPDRGHRCFAVPGERAARAVTAALEGGGLSRRFTFAFGTTVQTLFWDNTTVLIRHGGGGARLAPNALSLVARRPLARAHAAAEELRNAGFTAEVHPDPGPASDSKLVVVSSDAFDGWVLVFRRHVLAMGSPQRVRETATPH